MTISAELCFPEFFFLAAMGASRAVECASSRLL
jgi:hypothetical protein